MSGGGIALGPKPRSYRQHTPKKMVRLALLSALSDRAANDRVALVDQWGWDGPKTKDAVAALRNLKITGTVLVVLADDETIAGRSFANLPNVHDHLVRPALGPRRPAQRLDRVLRPHPARVDGCLGRAGSRGGGGRRREPDSDTADAETAEAAPRRPSRRGRADETEEAATDA